MKDFRINDYTLNQEAKDMARLAVLEELEYGRNGQDILHEMCDGHEWAIYTHKALQVCAECNTDDGEEYLEDLGQSYTDIGAHASAVAYATLLAKATEHFYTMREKLEND